MSVVQVFQRLTLTGDQLLGSLRRTGGWRVVAPAWLRRLLGFNPPRNLFLALGVNLVLQLLLIASLRYRLSYDAYVHMFFADHYRLSWWSLWEPRWYTGFSVVSYPPLVHQLIALVSTLTGIEFAFALVLLAVLALLPLGIFVFARVFVGRAAAGYAALFGAVLPSIYLSAHTFGQLPTLTGTLASLFGLAALAAYLRKGRILDGILAVSLMAVVAAAHHGSLLFLPYAVAGVALHLILNQQVSLRRWLFRLGLFGALSVCAILLVIWPFWQWGLGQIHVLPPQTPIDHLSRHNFILDPIALGVFFWPMYGPLLFILPGALWWIVKTSRLDRASRRRFSIKPFSIALCISFFFLFILGLGGTTPLPGWLYGPGWAWLTYDRFSLWASIVLLPIAGQAAILARRGRMNASPRWRRAWPILEYAAFGAMAFVALQAALLATILPTQPRPLNMQPIVQFLDEGDHALWRYLTFGFGDQLARLSTLTKATTMDGSYHTARELPELRSSGIGQIDTAYWSKPGLKALGPILQRASALGVRWGFVNLPAYRPVLRRQGWVRLETLPDGVEVWENPKAALPQAQDPAEHQNPLAAESWGLFPMTALAVTAGTYSLRRKFLSAGTSERQFLAELLRKLHFLAVGVLPVSLTFWYFYQFGSVERANVYFTYSNALFFASDGLITLAVGAWALAWLLDPHPLLGKGPGLVTWPLLSLACLASLSVAWSVDPRISTYMALHLWLMFGLYLSLLDEPGSWRAIALGGAFAILLQVGISGYEFLTQSTAFLDPLQLKWPGDLVPAIRGASVVELMDGRRWLRAYGSLPHPNILAGILVGLMAAPVAAFLQRSATTVVKITTPVVAGLGNQEIAQTDVRAHSRTRRLESSHSKRAGGSATSVVKITTPDVAGLGSRETARLEVHARSKPRSLETSHSNTSWWALGLFGLATAGMVLTFSRASWIGYAVGALILFLRKRYLNRKRLTWLGITSVLCLAITLIPLWSLVFTRVAGVPVHTEIRSTQERISLGLLAIQVIKAHPAGGVGAGAYVIAVASQWSQAGLFEPVHNLLLLVTSELGLAGGLLCLLVGAGFLFSLKYARSPQAIALSASVAALMVMGLLDHFLWSQAAGRALGWMVLGAWAGQISQKRS